MEIICSCCYLYIFDLSLKALQYLEFLLDTEWVNEHWPHRIMAEISRYLVINTSDNSEKENVTDGN